MKEQTLHPVVSVFMPVYNGAAYLPRTLDSILAQDFTDFEVVCVDDSSTDESYAVLCDYARRDSRIRVFRKENGGTVPHSWVFALPHMRGEYLFYTSQDDLYSLTLLGGMVSRAWESGADGVMPVMEYYYDGKPSDKRVAGFLGDTSVVIDGRKAFLASLDWSIHGFVLWRGDLVREVGYDTVAMNSDEYATRCFFLASSRIAFCEDVFRYRKDNAQAITRKLSVRLFDYLVTDRRLYTLIRENGFCEDVSGWFLSMWFGNVVRWQVRLLRFGETFSKADRTKAQRIVCESFLALDKSKLWRYLLTRNTKNRFSKLALLSVALGNYGLFSFYVRIGAAFSSKA